MSEKPLHVQIAEAIGWTEMAPRKEDGLWGGQPPDVSWWASPPRYDTSWSATGPLIEKYQISVWPRPNDVDEGPVAKMWGATFHPDATRRSDESRLAQGESPLIAVCNLILSLKEAGKL